MLPKVPGAGSPDIQILCILTMQAAAQDSEGIGMFWHHDQVHMIAHEAVSQNANASLCAMSGQEVEIHLVIRGLKEDALAIRTALRDVVRQLGQNASGVSRHTEKCVGARVFLTWDGAPRPGMRILAGVASDCPLRSRTGIGRSITDE